MRLSLVPTYVRVHVRLHHKSRIMGCQSVGDISTSPKHQDLFCVQYSGPSNLKLGLNGDLLYMFAHRNGVVSVTKDAKLTNYIHRF